MPTLLLMFRGSRYPIWPHETSAALRRDRVRGESGAERRSRTNDVTMDVGVGLVASSVSSSIMRTTISHR